MKTIGFYKAHDPFGWCSNFYEAPVVIDNILYKTTEHYYQAAKFIQGSDVWRTIVAASTPQEVVKIARTTKLHIANWDDVKFGIMRKAVFNKFLQHSHLATLLKETGDAVLVEDTIGTIRPDAWWGNGKNGEGRNWLGKILMEVREVINES